MTISKEEVHKIEEATHSQPVFQNYTCYRTKRRGWQDAGFVILSGWYSLENPPPTVADSPVWEGMAWVLDPDFKYKQGEVYPELVADQASNTVKATA